MQPVEAVTENCVRLTDIRAQCMQIFRMSERVYVCVCHTQIECERRKTDHGNRRQKD